MHLYEYQAKELLKRSGIKVPSGGAISSLSDAINILHQIKSDSYVIKAQIHAGGRGKAGGIRIVRSEEDAIKVLGEMLGRSLVTAQTGTEGELVEWILIEEFITSEKALYIGVVIDREIGSPCVLISQKGGVDVEHIIQESPELLLKERIYYRDGLYPFQKRRILHKLGIEEILAHSLIATIRSAIETFYSYDCTLLEINPLSLDISGNWIALDAKIIIDDNAFWRQKEIRGLLSSDRTIESEAFGEGLSYVRFNGDIGCIVNGAGLAMATIDLIRLTGGKPANFLDIGGGASLEKIKKAFRLLASDKRVKSIIINIFGGILRCDLFAKGIIEAVREIRIDVPVVVRLKGTNVEEGKRLIQESGVGFVFADTMLDAVEIALRIA